jgi:hypothetical protein
MVADLCKDAPAGVFNIAGLLSIEELVSVIRDAQVIVSVNTAIIHMAAAMQTPVVVLYALTNPQHTPWKVPYIMLPFSFESQLKSRNEVIQYVDRKLFSTQTPYPTPGNITESIRKLIATPKKTKARPIL